MRIELLDQLVTVEGVPRYLVVVLETPVEQFEVGLALGLVAPEATEHLVGVGGLEQAEDWVEQEY